MKDQQPDDIDFFDELDLALSVQASDIKPPSSFLPFAKESDFQSSESVLPSPFSAANAGFDNLFEDHVIDDADLALLLEDVPNVEDLNNHGEDHKTPNFPNLSSEKTQAPEVEDRECSSKALADKPVLKKQGKMQRERRFACEFDGCEKRFFEKSKLKRHQVVHTKEKNHKCPVCLKLLGYKANIKAHLRTHTGEKPFKCSIPGCSKSFAQDSNRKTHEKTHLKRKRNSDVVETDVSIPPPKR